MTRNEALKHPYCVMLRTALTQQKNPAVRAAILKQIDLKVDLLMGKIDQETYNNALFASMSNMPGINNAISSKNFWNGFMDFLDSKLEDMDI